MLKAEQLALRQQYTQRLLAIQGQELNFLVQSFTQFATNAALLAGFILQSLTSIDVDAYGTSAAVKLAFYICASLSLVCALHCVVTTTLITIWGPGLALNGRSGSVERAVEGMAAERSNIQTSFALSVLFFTSTASLTVWIVANANIPTGVLATLIFVGGGMYTVRHVAACYDRFLVHDVLKGKWKDEEFDELQLKSGSDDDSSAAMRSANVTTSVSPRNADMTGYLTKRAPGEAVLGSDQWDRRFFALSGGSLFYYKSREDFMQGKAPIKNRPIKLRGYLCVSCDGDGTQGSIVERASQITMDPPYVMRLSPASENDERREWVFRCDTDEELVAWVEALRGAINRANVRAGGSVTSGIAPFDTTPAQPEAAAAESSMGLRRKQPRESALQEPLLS